MQDKPESIEEKFSQVVLSSDSPGEFEATSLLSEQLEKEKTKRKEERLLWMIVFIVLFDIHCLVNCQNWSLPWIIAIFEAAIIFALAHKWSVKPIELVFIMLYELFQKKR